MFSGPKIFFALLLTALPALAQSHLHPLAGADRGRAAASRPMGVVTVVLRKTPEQQADLDRLLAAQQTPGAAEYHRWLTPAQYGDRFGASAEDTRRVAEWLSAQGLKIEAVAPSRTWIAVSGAVAGVERALHTQIHEYLVDGELRYAPSAEPVVPADLERVVAGFDGLNDFDRRGRRDSPMVNFTDGTHGLVPDDFAAIYNIAPLYGSGIDGTGQTMVVAGRSNIDISDVQFFRTRFGLPKNDPEIVVFGPDPGFLSAGDVAEAVLDVDWAGAVARNAHIIYVASTSVFASVTFAVEQNLAPVVSYSFSTCEAAQTDVEPLLRRAVAQQANAQGITWVASSGDSGAAGCDVHGVNPVATKGLAANLPGTLPEVTSVGGTQLNEGSGTYWAATNDSKTLASALTYIPEVAWNDSAGRNSPVGSGGGSSILFPKPAWQTGLGVPTANARHTPDIAFTASSTHDGYVIYLGGVTTRIGGTSASAPVFGAVLTLLNQYAIAKGLESRAGLGNVNPALYRMAQTTPLAFHDITAGDNRVPCAVNSPDCQNGLLGYAAAPGYDLATGLGSLDVFRFATGWNPAGAVTTTDLTLSAASVTLNDTVVLTATVKAVSGGAAPKGVVSFSQGHTLFGTAALTAGMATMRVSAALLVTGPAIAGYTGDDRLNGSLGTAQIAVTLPKSNSAVIPSLTNPVYQHAPDADGFTFNLTIQLTEAAGVATTVTGVTIDGAAQNVGDYFSSVSIPAKGGITATVRGKLTATPLVRVYGFTGQDADGFQWSQEVAVQFYGAAYFTAVDSIVNAASGQALYAPGMILSVMGTGLSSATLQALSKPLPLVLGSTRATVNGVAAPMFWVSPTQVNLQIPYETAVGTAVLEMNTGGQKYSYSFKVAGTAPGIFLDSPGNLFPSASGARGQAGILFVTGEGAVTPALATGASPDTQTPLGTLPSPVKPVVLTIGSVAAKVNFARVPWGVTGATMVNFTVPDTAPVGMQLLTLSVGGVFAPSVAFTVLP